MGDRMHSVAVYNLKGGVGKTTSAVNLAWCSAVLSSRRTLLWDLDPQGAASHLIGDDKAMKDEARSIFARDVSPEKLVRPSRIPGLDLLAADHSLRGLDRMLFEIGKAKRLKKLIEGLGKHYDRIVLDCPPGLSETSDQVLRAADLVIVPIIPSPLSQRAFAEVQHYLDGKSGRHAPMLPVFVMVDRRRALHKQALEAIPTGRSSRWRARSSGWRKSGFRLGRSTRKARRRRLMQGYGRGSSASSPIRRAADNAPG